MRLIKETIFLTVVLMVFERDIRKSEQVFKTPGPIVSAMTAAMDRVSYELGEVQRGMRRRAVKVYGEKVSRDGVEAAYNCRGYEGKVCFPAQTARDEVEIRMSLYLGINISSVIGKYLPELGADSAAGVVH
ncbi:hypothetical protein [Paenibacillus hamazuiensis]|uniref:hypothetical protein n=1 Tax=Paenibacillus hamazuiensis TaxID=2936508 RepID=UPI00200DFACD|nr:hypothetical protein [Paenibacillus hamazuiensis]